MKQGDKVYVPSLRQEVVVTTVVDGQPVQGTFIDTDGIVKIVDLAKTAWEVLTLLKKLWYIIRTLFKQ